MLLVEKPSDGVAVVTLNRPEAMNALSKALRAALQQAIAELDADPDVRVIVLTGAGERAFTAGLDLKELSTDPLGMGAANATDPAENPARAVLSCSKPIIGAINGVAITGGFEVALACDVLLCSTNARFADTHARVGITPGWGLSQRLPRLIGANRAKELSLTGNYLDAQTACAWGLVNRVVPADELMTTCIALARDILSTEPVTRGEIKRLIDAGWNSTLEEGLRLEDEASKAHSKREVRPDKVAARRAAIQARGREQSAG